MSDLAVPSKTWTDRNGDGVADPGETITYSIAITNTGSVSLYDVEAASDTMETEGVECPAFPERTLAPNATMKCFAEYEVKHGKGSPKMQRVFAVVRIE